MPKQATPSAKVASPRLAAVVERPRLYRALDRARKRRLVFVQGPAGAGKTTLVASHLRARGLRAAWYRVDARDADVATLFYFLGHSPLLREKPRVPLPQPPRPLAPGLAAYSRRFFEALADNLPARTVLVFDNLQDVPDGAPFLTALREGLDALPADRGAILIGRGPLPQPFAADQARGELAIVDWPELRFNLDETLKLGRLKAPRGARTSRAALARLHKLCDGWAAGMVLLLEQHGKALPEVVEPEGSPQLFDYVAAELFARLNDERQALLLRTALLPPFTDQLAEAVSAIPTARAILGQLHRHGFFVQRLAGQAGSTYEYHPLLKAFLEERARRDLPPEERDRIYQRAAAWYDEKGHPEEALALLERAGSTRAFVEAVLKQAPSWIEGGRSETLASWLDRIPPLAFEDRAELWYWRAVATLSRDPQASTAHYARAFELARRSSDPMTGYLSWAGGVQSIAILGVDVEPLDDWVLRFREVQAEGWPPPETFGAAIDLQVSSSMLLAMIFRAHHEPDVLLWAERTERLCFEVPPEQAIIGFAFLSVYMSLVGDLARMAELSESFQGRARTGRQEALFALTGALCEAHVLLWGARLAESLEHAEQSLTLADSSGVHLWDLYFTTFGAQAAIRLGERERARRLIERLKATTGHKGLPRGFCLVTLIWEALFDGDLARARVLLRRLHELSAESHIIIAEAVGQIGEAVVDALDGRPERSAEHLAQAIAIARRIRSQMIEQSAALWDAYAAVELGRRAPSAELAARARASLERVFELHRGLGCFPYYFTLPEPMARLCHFALEHGIAVQQVGLWIRRWGLRPPRDLEPIEEWPSALRIRTLGVFSIERDGAPLAMEGRVPRVPLRLLKALVAHARGVPGRRIVAEATLEEALWPELDGDLAHHNLENNCHRLRKLLGTHEVFRVADGCIDLDDAVWIDAHALDLLCDRVLLRAFRPDDVDRLAERLLGLYRGPFLPGEHASWAVSTRERLRERYVRSVLLLGGQLEAQDRREAAAEVYERALVVEELAEPLYGALIRCHAALGRLLEARATLERCERVLQSQLGNGPSDALRALVRAT